MLTTGLLQAVPWLDGVTRVGGAGLLVVRAVLAGELWCSVLGFGTRLLRPVFSLARSWRVPAVSLLTR